MTAPPDHHPTPRAARRRCLHPPRPPRPPHPRPRSPPVANSQTKRMTTLLKLGGEIFETVCLLAVYRSSDAPWDGSGQEPFPTSSRHQQPTYRSSHTPAGIRCGTYRVFASFPPFSLRPCPPPGMIGNYVLHAGTASHHRCNTNHTSRKTASKLSPTPTSGTRTKTDIQAVDREPAPTTDQPLTSPQNSPPTRQIDRPTHPPTHLPVQPCRRLHLRRQLGVLLARGRGGRSPHVPGGLLPLPFLLTGLRVGRSCRLCM